MPASRKELQQSLLGDNTSYESRQLLHELPSNHDWLSINYPNLLCSPLPVHESPFTANTLSFTNQQISIPESADWLNFPNVTIDDSQVLSADYDTGSRSLSHDFTTSFPVGSNPFSFDEAAPYLPESHKTNGQGQESPLVLSNSHIYHSLSTSLQDKSTKDCRAYSELAKDNSSAPPRPTAPTSPIPTTASTTNVSSPSRIEKRKLNTLAARRYRQKRVDQISGLEAALKETQLERDALKVRVARLEGEAETLRQLLQARK
ncbi:hypothetical protein AOQ84DRAFT_387485 [Glonium stellatum]|uniref:BZIP domain-containing protein n=1 Tax=Glonium stellatum TaxID=574774 RepID=A0A8E2F4W9_9PEZI|nr:hypothetical protein AOQ84DRAFT_387485 [Glonium stellatum]